MGDNREFLKLINMVQSHLKSQQENAEIKKEEVKEVVTIPIKSSIESKVEKDLNEAVKEFELNLKYSKEESVYYKPDKYKKLRRFIISIIALCLNLYILKDVDFFIWDSFYRAIPNLIWVSVTYTIMLVGFDIYFANRKDD